MPVVTTEHLRTLQQQLRHFVTPENDKGFYRVFLIWVINSWRKSRFYDTEIRELGHARSLFPVATDEWLRDRVSCYKEFINANTGGSAYAFQPGVGICCETYEARLQELYGNACNRQIERFVSQHCLVMPPHSGSEEAPTVSDAILHKCFDSTRTLELASIGHEIRLEFNSRGWGQAPYTCPISRSGNYADNLFGTWSLRDFKNAMLV